MECPIGDHKEFDGVRENLLPLVKAGYSFIASDIKKKIDLKSLYP